MGQQQILFLILALCVVGIAISAGVINHQASSVDEYREAISHRLGDLATSAQEYYRRSEEDGGGESSFIGLTANRSGIEKLTQNPSVHGVRYSIERSGNTKFVRILAVGTFPGNDPRYPVKMLMTVWPTAASTEVLN